jgi:hypothetical protein
MQTFLPYHSFSKCAQCLDNKRLNKQIVEACQISFILNFIDENGCLKKSYSENKDLVKKYGKTPAWIHHPAVLMWIGYETSLDFYINACIKEWERRTNKKRNIKKTLKISKCDKPHWLTETFTITHKSNLLRKSDFYNQYSWNVSSESPYYWPFVWSSVNNSRIEIKEDLFIKISKDTITYKLELNKIKYIKLKN